LIALNVGLDAGIISQRLFTVFVLMALIATLMTGSLLSLTRAVRTEQMPATQPTANLSGRQPRVTITAAITRRIVINRPIKWQREKVADEH
jgi:hypothetical protein